MLLLPYQVAAATIPYDLKIAFENGATSRVHAGLNVRGML